MKKQTILLAVLSVVVVTASCSKTETTAEKIDQLGADAKAAAQDFADADYTFAQKQEFTEKLKAQLAEINRELDELAARIENSSDAVKAEARPKLQALRDQADKLKAKIDEAGNATESTWDSVKAGSKEAYANLKDGFQQARQWVSEKIAP
jgi:peptidoglycan hydrolase CwlO-like protein